MFSFFYDWDSRKSCCCMLSSPRAGRVVDTNKDTYIKQQQSCTIRDKMDIQTTAGATHAASSADALSSDIKSL